MKPSVAIEDTRRVLADIEAVVLQVEMARTAAAVERVLATASPGVFESPTAAQVVRPLFAELGVFRPQLGCAGGAGCGCVEDVIPVDGLPGLWHAAFVYSRDLVTQRALYAPWVVSPHLFEEGS